MPSGPVWGLVATGTLLLLAVVAGLWWARRTRAKRSIGGVSVELRQDGLLISEVQPGRPRDDAFRFVVVHGFIGWQVNEASGTSPIEDRYELRRRKDGLSFTAPGGPKTFVRPGFHWPVSKGVSLVIQDHGRWGPQPGAAPGDPWAPPTTGSSSWDGTTGEWSRRPSSGGSSRADPVSADPPWYSSGSEPSWGPASGVDPFSDGPSLDSSGVDSSQKHQMGGGLARGPLPGASSSRKDSSTGNSTKGNSSDESSSREDSPRADPATTSDLPSGWSPSTDDPCEVTGKAPSQYNGDGSAENDNRPFASPLIDADVQFTAYPPLAVRRNEWYTLLVFAHKGDRFTDDAGRVIDAFAEVERQADFMLGSARQDYTKLRTFSAQALPRGGILRFVPNLAGVVFNPQEVAFQWLEPLHRQEFRLSVQDSYSAATLEGCIAVYRDMFLIAEIPLRIAISDDAPIADSPSVRTPAVLYRKIFASYSHRDADVVDSVMQLVRSTGDDYLRDVVNLRAGEVWNDRLMEMIDEADLFQLFWSSNSMRSLYVRSEWEYALKSTKRSFVRPVYWEDPQPEDRALDLPPDALRRLHFAKLPLRAAALSSTAQPEPSRHIEQLDDLESAATRPTSCSPRSTSETNQTESNKPILSAPEKPLSFDSSSARSRRALYWTIAAVAIAVSIVLPVILVLALYVR